MAQQKNIRSGILARFLCAAVLTVLAGATSQAADQPVAAVYFTGWGIYDANYQVADLPANQITHIYYAFAQPRYRAATDTADLIAYDSYADSVNFPALRQLKTQHPNLKTLISIGGWTLSDDFSDAVATAHARSTFAASCIAFMTNGGFDGIDIDWEYPVDGGLPSVKHRTADRDNLLAFVTLLRQQLNLLTQQTHHAYLITLAACEDADMLTTRYRIKELSVQLDWINVMSYDSAGPWDTLTGHNSPLYANPGAQNPRYNVRTSIEAFLAQGVKPSAIVVGLPYYGRSYANVSGANHGLFQAYTGTGPGTWEAGVLTYADCAANYVNKNGYVRFWDSVAEAPYLYNATNHIFISYDDAESVKRKIDYVRQNGLRGAMCWSVDNDSAAHDLQRTVYEGLNITPTWQDGAVDMGGNWKWLDWFGYFADSGNGWIFHREHGWMYCAGAATPDAWFWTPDLGWLWISKSSYPSLYSTQDRAWLWYLKDSSSPRWFYNCGSASWQSH